MHNTNYNKNVGGGQGSGARMAGMRSTSRRVIDLCNPILAELRERFYIRDCRDYEIIQPHSSGLRSLLPPYALRNYPISSFCFHHAHTSTNKQKNPINCLAWTKEGRRIVTGNANGEFTLWNGAAFNFETILQAHDVAVRSLCWSPNGDYLVSGDNNGVIKYWESTLTPIQSFVAHSGLMVRDIKFSPTDNKFVSCCDDYMVRVWDWSQCIVEKELIGHGWDVRSVDWHPYFSLIGSGSKDNTVKLWDPRRGGMSVATYFSHNNAVTKVRWNKNGNWLLSASRDQTIRVFDIRKGEELAILRGHDKDVSTIAWHPIHEKMFVSGALNGVLMFWLLGIDQPCIILPKSHDGTVWDAAFHPGGNILATSSNDNTTKFWSRSRPGEKLDRHIEEGEEEDFEEEDDKLNDEQENDLDWSKTKGFTEDEINIVRNKKKINNSNILLGEIIFDSIPGINERKRKRNINNNNNNEKKILNDNIGGMFLPLATREACIKSIQRAKKKKKINTLFNIKNDKEYKQPIEVIEAGQKIEIPLVLRAEPQRIPPEGYTCNRCGSSKHYINDCPQGKLPPANYVCYNCGRPGHWRKDCDLKKSNNNNNNNNNNK